MLINNQHLVLAVHKKAILYIKKGLKVVNVEATNFVLGVQLLIA